MWGCTFTTLGSVLFAEYGGFHLTTRSFDLLMCTFSGEGRGPVNYEIVYSCRANSLTPLESNSSGKLQRGR